MASNESIWKHAFKQGLIGGVVVVLVSLIGMVEAFSNRDIIEATVTMGHTLVLIIAIFITYLAVGKAQTPKTLLGAAALTGLVMGTLVALLVILGGGVNLRTVFINASPKLFALLRLGVEGPAGLVLLLAVSVMIGLGAGLLRLIPALSRRVLITALGSVAAAGVLQDLLRPTFAIWGPLSRINDWIYANAGLNRPGALALFVLVGMLVWLWAKKGDNVKAAYRQMPADRQGKFRQVGFVFLALVLLIAPQILGLFLSEVLTIVGLYVLLGLGLNIVVGFAGLLDLGYVAFFAIGSYVVALMTSPEVRILGAAIGTSFWVALPFALALGTLAGAMLGVPVLKMRGDYLAITTLGFGEIIRILVLSDFLRPWLGGAQGLGRIPKVQLVGFEFSGPQQIYYLILAGCLLVAFISIRLRDSRLGRAWMALREDEDVAQAMGINLVSVKLLAFATGAGFSALSGAIFSTKLGSVYPHSFNVMISINILCLIIVGGMGSIPGVVVGAFALVGLPELLREFAEYRLLVYGVALVAMMLVKPEGLWPEAVRRRELHDEPMEEGA